MLATIAGLGVGTAVAALALRARLRRRYYERLLDTPYGDLSVAQRRGLRAVLPQLADLEPAMAGAIAGYSAYQVAWSLEHLDPEVLTALRLAAGHDLAHQVEVAVPHLALVPRRRVAVLLCLELRPLEFGVRSHAALPVRPREREHAVVQRVEAGERDELEAVAHGGQLALEDGEAARIEVTPPVERRRAVVGQQLARIALMDRFRKAPRLAQVRRGRLAPQQVRVGGVGERARDRALEPAAHEIGRASCRERV